MHQFPWKVLPVLLVLFSLPLHAQSFLGISGGGGLANEVAFRAGLPLEFHLKPQLAIQAEAAFVQRVNYGVLTHLPRARNYLQPVITYLEFPVSLKVGLPFEGVRFYGTIGFQVGCGVQIGSTYEEDKLVFAERLDFAQTGISRLDAGVLLGGGIEKEISQGRKIFMEMRYYLGLYNISSLAGESSYNAGAHFSLGFLIPLRRP